MGEESAPPPPLACADAEANPASKPEKTVPTPPAPSALVGGDAGDEATPEPLDWGSIDDEDGAFGQISQAARLQDPDPTLPDA